MDICLALKIKNIHNQKALKGFGQKYGMSSYDAKMKQNVAVVHMKRLMYVYPNFAQIRRPIDVCF